VLITLNMGFLVCAIYFADSFLHAPADILVESEAQSAEAHMRYGVISSIKLEEPDSQKPLEVEIPDDIYKFDADHISCEMVQPLRRLNENQRLRLEADIHKSSYHLANSIIDAVSQNGKGESARIISKIASEKVECS